MDGLSQGQYRVEVTLDGFEPALQGIALEPRQTAAIDVTLNAARIKDYQTQVVNAQVGGLRGYLANAEKVRVRGAEFDGTAQINRHLEYFEFLTAQPGNSGLYVGLPGDPRTIGLTVRMNLRPAG